MRALVEQTRAWMRRFGGDDRGATAVEYGLLAALIAVAIIAAMDMLGNSNNGSWGRTASRAAAVMGN